MVMIWDREAEGRLFAKQGGQRASMQGGVAVWQQGVRLSGLQTCWLWWGAVPEHACPVGFWQACAAEGPPVLW